MALVSLLLPSGAAAGVGQGILESVLGEHINRALNGHRRRKKARRRGRNPGLAGLAELDPEIGIPERIAMRMAQKRLEREQQAEENPDFFEDRRGVIHPIRSSRDYDDVMTAGRQRWLQERYPDIYYAMREEGHLRPSRQQTRRLEEEQRGVERDYRRDVKLTKPGWARGWSQTDLHELADFAGVSPSARLKNDWADHVDPMAVVEFRAQYGKHKLTLPRERLAHDPAYKRYLARQSERRVSVAGAGRRARQARSRARGNPSGYMYELPMDGADLLPYSEEYSSGRPLDPEEEAFLAEQKRQARNARLASLPKRAGRRRRRRVKVRDFSGEGVQPGLFGDRFPSDLRARDRGTYQYRMGNPGLAVVRCCRCHAGHQVRPGATHFVCRGCGAHNGIRRSA